MIPLIGLPRELLRNPMWFNANTGASVQPDGKHHYHMFTHAPERVGLQPSDLSFKVKREDNRDQWELAYTNMVIRLGWTRIDVVGDGTVVVVAGRLDWAEAAIRAIPTSKVSLPVTRLIVVVFPQASVTEDEVQRFDLSGDALLHVQTNGLDSWAKPRLLTAKPGSKMARSTRYVRGCPFARIA